MKKQTFENKIGEIEFKKKLFSQQISGKKVFDNEFDSNGIESILAERMAKTKNQMLLLKKDGIAKSPYVEIGAERGQRSLVMENDIGLVGAAADLSFDMLASCNYYKKKFEKEKDPLKICCDAYNLPFSDNSVQFVFCYETLHHFPDPTPILKEIYRILVPGGYFFFDEEPCKGFLQLKLFKSKHKIYSKEASQRSLPRKIFEYFLYKKSCNEIDYGIIENDMINAYKWKKYFSIFKEADIKLETTKSLMSVKFYKDSPLKFFISSLLGGIISGLCGKEGAVLDTSKFIEECLRCPDCALNNKTSNLKKDLDFYNCELCNKKFKTKDGVLFLFENETLKKLYSKII